jgi:uncharacterized membrane protein YdjX (TVP38/TMEM64 family)
LSHHPLHLRRVLILALVLLAAVAVARSDTVNHAVRDVLGAAQALMAEYPRSGMALFFVLCGLSAMLTFFSSAALVPIGVFVWGPETTFVLLWLGGSTGGVAGYWVARTLGRRVIDHLYPDGPFRRYERFFATQARWRTIMIFRLALQSELPSYVLGLVKYPFRRYLPTILLAELPYVFVMVYLGETFLERNSTVFIAVLLAAVGLTVLAFRMLKKEMAAAEAAPT